MNTDLTMEEIATIPFLTAAIQVCLGQTYAGMPGRSEEMLRRMVDGYGLKSTRIDGPDGSPYMTRYSVSKRENGGRIYLDHLHRADMDPDPHDHPWNGMSVLRLLYTYIEWSFYKDDHSGWQWSPERRPAGSVYRVPGDGFHRIAQLEHTSAYSIIATGPWFQKWGFLDVATGERVLHDEYFARRSPVGLPAGTSGGAVLAAAGLLDRPWPTLRAAV